MSYDLENFYKTTLLLDWTIGTGNFYVTTLPTISTGWLVISPNNSTLREIVKYSATGTDSNGNYITVITRGVGGTTEQTHSAGEPIRMNITAEYWASMQSDIDSIVAAGASNANTTTRGIVEEATAAEIDARTQTGSTGAELFINPKLLHDAHNVPTVAPGTSGNVMSSNGTDWTSVTLASLLPTPFFQQTLPTNNTTVYNTCISGSNTDGSVLYIYEADTAFKRYARDTNTGMYKMTHNINPTLSTSKGMIIQVGSYIYLFSTATNIVSTRFLAADLTGETTMTVPTVAAGNVTAWTDGTYAYLVSDNTNTTSRKWSVSGTTWSAVSTATCTNTLEAISTGRISSIYDGTNYYVIEGNLNGTGSGMWSIHKLADVVGTSVTTTTITFGDADYGDDVYGAITAVIDSTKMYIGQMHTIYNATTTDTMQIILMPVTKP